MECFLLPIALIIWMNFSQTCGATAETPEWPPTYIVKGVIYIPYAEINEPFASWYDASVGKSRVDYYGGMVKTYQLSTEGNYGTSLKIAPMTTETELNAVRCFLVNGTKQQKIQPQSVLPALDGFEMIGQEVVNGLMTEKWRKIEKFGDEKLNKYTMYLRWKKSPKAPKQQIPIPVRYEMKGFNSLLGSHYDHYYLNYEEFTWDSPPADVFIVGNQTACGSFPGPGEDHIVSFNPMSEFIEGVTHHVDSAWEEFQQTHKKVYHPDEHHTRKHTFVQNLRLIASHNRANLGFTLAVNHLADRTPAELKVLRGRRHTPGYNGGKPFPYDTAAMAASLPEQFDWRIYGAVTPVKDQSVCGSCWSFGTTGHVEGAYFVKTGRLVRLSQQALVDCSWGEGNNGCDGGEDFRAYQWIMKHGGLPLEGEYGGYLGQDGYCHINQTQMVAPITGYVNVTSNDPDALKIALLKHGPISVAIDASQRTFSFYSNGVYNSKNCKNNPDGLDHAVLLVGYGKIGDRSYWLIKNSWSNYWGNDGYILMDPVDNNCGVMTAPTYVTM
ncbi:digestive cysteine proteinase 1-like isoform X1 [Macrosteles quadrilineatus]|uniref:digestive cysteine proteinase 1-like isoform X1 n=1 Tax=Macrosteles quadrilineatus TaxID=74068 RepID=UPI0023E17C5E|nr:digestive cysteine proteinase 1-like isoform X1 [Macrosteles quadrilineatus]